MPKGYSGNGPNAAGTSNKTAVELKGGTTVRARIYDIILGSSATPADNACLFALTRTTTAGTGASNPTPLALDPGDVAALIGLNITNSAEGTMAATDVLEIGMNQRATFRWVAAPGSEVLTAATASNGAAVRLVSASASLAMQCTVLWVE